MRACKTCKHLVHTTCAVHVSFRVEVVCKVCTPRPREHQPPAKREKRRFRTEWQAGRPWLQHANGVMWCAACQEYPQPGVQQSWVTGNRQLRHTTVRQHGNSGLHCKSLALWESGGTSTTVIGTLPVPIRRAINGLFQVVYRMAKRGSPPAHIPGDAEALMLSGGTVTTAYHSPSSVRQIVHAIAAPIRSVEGQAIETSLFLALASDSSTVWVGDSGSPPPPRPCILNVAHTFVSRRCVQSTRTVKTFVREDGQPGRRSFARCAAAGCGQQ